MIHKYIQFCRVERPPDSETAAEARLRLGDKFPRGATRRMTHLGMLVGAALDGIRLSPDDAIVYATTFAETRALEDFLVSFPAASPQLFQTSIHPSAVQQVMIGRQQPVQRFWPITGLARLVEHALVAALLEPASRVVVLGGEERGSWLLEQNVASDRAFAFALVLGTDAAGAVGRVRLVAPSVSEAAGGSALLRSPLLPAFTNALHDRRPQAWQAPAGEIRIDWS